MAYLSLDPVSVGISTALNTPALTALAAGGIGDTLDQRVAAADGGFATFVLYEVHEDSQLGGLGTKPGRSAMPVIDLRVHVFWVGLSLVPGQAAMAKVIELLSADNAVTISGYTVCGTEPVYDQSVYIPDQVVAGVTVHELVSLWRLTVKEA